MNVSKKSLAAIVAAGAIAAGAGIPAIAQEADDQTTQEQGVDETREERRAEREAAFAEALAAELGLPTEDVAEAIATVRDAMRAEHEAERLAHLQERLDEAVANGDLTQEQADAMIAAAEAGVFPGPGGRGHHGPRGGGFGPGGDDTTDADGAAA